MKKTEPEQPIPQVIYLWWHTPKQNIHGVVECLHNGAAIYVDLRKIMEETGHPPSWYVDRLEQAFLSKVRPIRFRIDAKYDRPLRLVPNVHAAIGLLNEQGIFNADSDLITPEFGGAVEYVTAQIGLALAEALPRKDS